MKFKEFLLENAKILQSLVALITILLFAWGIMKVFFTTSDLEVLYQYSDAEIPSSIGEKYAKNLEFFYPYLKKNKDNKLIENVLDVNEYLNNTRNKVKFEITNNSEYTIKNLDIRIKNIKKLTAWCVTGNILQNIESNSIMRKMRNDESKGIITFSGIEKLPPRTTLIINIWGDIREYSFADPILITYDGGAAEIIRTSVVKGFNSFLFENSSFLVLLLLLVNIGGFLFVIDTICAKKKND
jgi:hypothetical protein